MFIKIGNYYARHGLGPAKRLARQNPEDLGKFVVVILACSAASMVINKLAKKAVDDYASDVPRRVATALLTPSPLETTLLTVDDVVGTKR